VGVEKMSVSFEVELGSDIRQAAEAEGKSVSAWLAAAARDRLRSEALGDAIREWERVYGEITEEELAEANRILDRAAKLGRSSQT